MRLFRISNILFLAVAATLGVLLFWTSQAVQKKEADLAEDKATLAQEQETVRVLSVEWDYLNRPQRLEKLAKEQLGMQLPSAQEVVTAVDQIPEPVEPATIPEAVPQPAIVHNVSTRNAMDEAWKPAPKVIPKKAETVSPSSAEKQSFDRLIQSLDQGGGQ